MANVVISIILILIVGSVCFYLYKQKKSGNHCIGCPYGKQCGKKASGECHKD
ncbi:MAG: FeoB-associated Cys-rich membrane protein [Spirochaetales bacterium]|nr:FeoB-associated Cys-rich membrane protein [Spirochaetales bacterium]